RFQWFFNETNLLLNATNSLLLLSDIQRAQAGNYSVRVSNRVGTVDSAQAQLQVRAGPRILQPPTNVTAIAGGTATFQVGADGDLPLAYQWFLDGTPVPNANSATLTLANVQPNQAGIYSVQISNATARVTSQGATLVVLVSPALVNQPGSL